MGLHLDFGIASLFFLFLFFTKIKIHNHVYIYVLNPTCLAPASRVISPNLASNYICKDAKKL